MTTIMITRNDIVGITVRMIFFSQLLNYKITGSENPPNFEKLNHLRLHRTSIGVDTNIVIARVLALGVNRFLFSILCLSYCLCIML